MMDNTEELKCAKPQKNDRTGEKAKHELGGKS